ncbi:hypothetical protein P3S67_022079 [Capsicum chacoense]
MDDKTEEYLLNKLDGALEQAQGSEDCLSKILFDIQTHFKNVNNLLREAKNGDHSDAGESSRRGILYYLLNALAKWQMLLERKRVYSPEGIRFAFALNSELKKHKSSQVLLFGPIRGLILLIKHIRTDSDCNACGVSISLRLCIIRL